MEIFWGAGGGGSRVELLVGLVGALCGWRRWKFQAGG